MPDKLRAWSDHLRAAAAHAGHTPHLWSLPALTAAFPQDPAAALLDALIAAHPTPPLYGIASDYFRLRLLAEYGGLYLDTDFYLRPGTPFPTLPSDLPVYGMPEFFSKKIMCNGLLYSPQTQPRTAFSLAADLAASRLATLFADIPKQAHAITSAIRQTLITEIIGPAWLQKSVLPAWESAGIKRDFLAADIAGHAQWKHDTPALVHTGEALWAKQHATPAPQAHPPIPEWATPQARAIIPAQPTIQPPTPHPPHPLRGKLLSIPEKARRIVILSNARKRFPTLCIKPGDCCIHINRAIHAERAMRVPDTTHLLIVRPSASRPLDWFLPQKGINGYYHVLCVRDSHILPSFHWYQQWRKTSPKSPTTGFIAANICREIYPEKPLILAGFAPDEDLGTYRWSGHDWQAEKNWYNTRDFQTLTNPTPHLHLLIASCRKNAEKRQACRDTWLSNPPPWLTYTFIIGRSDTSTPAPLAEPHPQEQDTLIVNAPDTYIALPSKIRAALQASMSNPFDWIGKCDDDTYLHLPAIAPILASAKASYLGRAMGIYWAVGGAGYFIRRHAAQSLTRDITRPDTTYPAEGAEDLLIGRTLATLGHNLEHIRTLHQKSAYTPHAASLHGLTPTEMRAIHPRFTTQ